MKHPFTPTCSVLLLALFAAGCSSFEAEYQAVSQAPASADHITGAWAGSWQSNTHGHGGELRAIVTPAGPGLFKARYFASYGGFFTFEHETLFRSTASGATAHLEGEEDLGWMAGGQYQYTGYATPEEFFSTYAAKDDEGTYTMRRPGGRSQ